MDPRRGCADAWALQGYNDSIEAYVAAIRKLPPFTWGVKIKGANGELVSNDVLLEKRSLTAQARLCERGRFLLALTTHR